MWYKNESSVIPVVGEQIEITSFSSGHAKCDLDSLPTINTGQHGFHTCWTQPEKKKQKYHPSGKFAGNLWGNVASLGSDKQCKMAWSGTWDEHSGTLPIMPTQPEIGHHLTIWHRIPFYLSDLSMPIFQPVKCQSIIYFEAYLRICPAILI